MFGSASPEPDFLSDFTSVGELFIAFFHEWTPATGCGAQRAFTINLTLLCLYVLICDLKFVCMFLFVYLSLSE